MGHLFWFKLFLEKKEEKIFKPLKYSTQLFSTPYLILTKLPPGNALIWACTVICFPGLFKDFIKYSGLVWNFFCQKLGLFFVIFVYLAYWWQSSFIMNRNIIFYPALFLVSFAKFLHACLFRTARLFSFCQNYTLHAYSGLRVIRVPSWIFIEYSCPS